MFDPRMILHAAEFDEFMDFMDLDEFLDLSAASAGGEEFMKCATIALEEFRQRNSDELALAVEYVGKAAKVHGAMVVWPFGS